MKYFNIRLDNSDFDHVTWHSLEERSAKRARFQLTVLSHSLQFHESLHCPWHLERQQMALVLLKDSLMKCF